MGGLSSGPHAALWRVNWILLALFVIACKPSFSKPGFSKDLQVCPNERRTGVRGRINSPNYPQPYDMNTCRQWFIQGDQHDVITLSFLDLDVPTKDTVGCGGDSFLHLGPQPDVMLCGDLRHQVPKVYISQRNHVWIKFHGSGRILGRGFTLYYVRGRQPYQDDCMSDEFRCHNGKCILNWWKCNGADECGDNSDEEQCHGGIKHPTTPGPWDCGKQRFGCFDNKTKGYVCHWNFRRCNGKVDCRDGEDERNCESRRVCGGAREGPTGYLATPNFPEPYPVNIDCEWLIHVTYGHRIQLRFTSFTLENHYDTDYVIVYDGGSDNADIIGKYYGGNRPAALIESTDNRIFIQFHSNKDSPEKGFNASFQIKGHCLPGQSKCVYGENDCYNEAQRCDGTWDCTEHGGDERGCGSCASHLFLCKEHETQCYAEVDHCNGISHCRNSHDEEECTPTQCGPHNGTFLCANRRCIYESWRCDGTDDCQDGSDEMHCYRPSVKVITAAVIGSLICGLLLVIALGCTCKLYALRLHEARANLALSTPISQLTEQMFARRLAPPPYNEAMLTSRPYEEAHQEYLEQLQPGHGGRSGLGRRGHHGRVAQGRSVPGLGPGPLAEEPLHLDDHDDVALIDISPGRMQHQGSQVDASQTNPGYLSSDCDGDDSDSTCDPAENSNVNISLATGMSAQWRRGRRKTRPRANVTGSEFAPIHRGTNLEDIEDSELSSEQQARDAASIETASASTDSVIIFMEDSAKADDDVPILSADPETPLPIHGSVSLTTLSRAGSDGESEDGSDSADLGDTEESVIRAEVHTSNTRTSDITR